MSITPDDIFAVAQRLAEAEACEASRRSSVSRAYYAALHKALWALPVSRLPKSNERSDSSHANVIGAFERWGKAVEPGRSDARHVARELSNLKRLRISADYALENEFSSVQLRDALMRSQAAMNHAEKCALAESKDTCAPA